MRCRQRKAATSSCRQVHNKVQYKSDFKFNSALMKNDTENELLQWTWPEQLTESPCVQRKESSSASSTLMYFAPPFYPRLTLHTHCVQKGLWWFNLGTKDQTHLFRNPLIFSRTKPESAEGPSSPGVQWSRIWEQNNSQTSRKRNRCCSTHSTSHFGLLTNASSDIHE